MKPRKSKENEIGWYNLQLWNHYGNSYKSLRKLESEKVHNSIPKSFFYYYYLKHLLLSNFKAYVFTIFWAFCLSGKHALPSRQSTTSSNELPFPNCRLRRSPCQPQPVSGAAPVKHAPAPKATREGLLAFKIYQSWQVCPFNAGKADLVHLLQSASVAKKYINLNSPLATSHGAFFFPPHTPRTY